MKKTLNKPVNIVILISLTIVFVMLMLNKNKDLWWSYEKASSRINFSKDKKIPRYIERYLFTDKWNNENKKSYFIGPITLDKDGYVYVMTGIPVSKLTSETAQLILSTTGYILTEDCYIEKFDSNGRFITKWKIADEGIFLGIESNTYIYIISYWSNLWVYDMKGKLVNHFKVGGRGVTCDIPGNIYITKGNEISRFIEKYDPNGNIIEMFPPCNEHSIYGTTYLFGDIVIDSSGFIYVVKGEREMESSSHYLCKIDQSKNLVVNFVTGYEWRKEPHITINETNKYFLTILVSDRDKDQIEEFSADGKFLGKFGSRGNRNGEFNNPGDMAVDSEGNVYVVDIGNNRIQKFAPNPMSKLRRIIK